MSASDPGAQREPLRPGESRTFVVDVPSSFDADTDVDAEKFGASVLHLQFAD